MIKPAESQFNDRQMEQYRDFLARMARHQLADYRDLPLEASDIVQSSLLEAFRQHASFQGKSPAEFAGWLRTVLKHNIADAIRGLRRAKRDVRRQCSLQSTQNSCGLPLEGWLVSDQSSPSLRLDRNERQLDLQRALGQLPSDQQQAVTLHHLDGLSLREVAQTMQRSEPAIAGLLFRGLRQLRKIMNGGDILL